MHNQSLHRAYLSHHVCSIEFILNQKDPIMEYVLILFLKYSVESTAVSQHTYKTLASCEYAKASAEALADRYFKITAICVKE